MIFESRDKAEEHDRELFLKNRLFKLLYNEFDTSPIDLDHVRDWMIRDANIIVDVLKDYVE